MSDQDRTRKTSNIVKRVDDLEESLQEYNAPVTSVNTKTGAVVLNAADVGALPDDTVIPPDYGPPPTLPEKIVNTVNGEDGDIVITPESIGALPDDTVIPEPNYPVTSVNSKTGAVVLNAADVGALPDDTVIPQPIEPPVTSVNTKTGVVVLSVEDLEDVVLTTETAGEVLQFDGANWVNAEVSAEGPYVRIDGTLPMSGYLKTPGIQGIQKRDANIDPNNPISFVEVIDGGSDGGDPSDDRTYFMCSSDIYFSNAPGTAIDVPAYKIANLKDPEDEQDGATKKYVDSQVSSVTGAVTSVNAKTGVVVLTADDVGALPASTTIPPNAPVDSVNAKTGVVVLTAADVGALPDDTVIPQPIEPPVTSVNAKTGVVVLTAADVGALPDDTVIPQPVEPPVTSVNTKTGAVVLTADDVGAKPNSYNAPVESVNTKTGVVVLDLDDINDVDISAATTGEVVTYDTGTAKWSPSGGGNVALGNKPDGGWSENTVGKAIEQAGESGGGGDFLPLAGGTMDAAADVIIPSGASVNANLQVGGVVGDTIRSGFNIAARGTTGQLNAQVVAWAKPGGSAYLKLCTTEDISSYWNILGSPADANGTTYLRFASEDQNWVTYSNTTDASDRKITHVSYTQFDNYIGTRFVYTNAKAENDCVIGLINNQVDIIRASLDVSPMLGTSELNQQGLGSDGIVVESADVFTAPEGWDDETQGDPAQQPDQPRSGIAFKGPYSIDNATQNYYASIEGVRGGRTDGYKSGACRISVNSTGSSVPSMNQAAYFGWDQTTIKSGNDNVVCNTKWTSQSIINQCTALTTKPVTENATGYLDFDYYDDSRASAIGWYPKDYEGGTVAGAGAGSTFFWANGGNVLSLAGDGIRINSQASGALTQYQWEFTTEGHLVSQGGQLQVNTITSKDDALDDVDILLNGKTASFQSDSKNKAVIGTYSYRRNNGDVDATASISSRNGTMQAYVNTIADQDVVALDIYEGINNVGAGMSIQWNNAGGAFNCPSSEILSKRVAGGANFALTFSAMVGNSLQEYMTLSDAVVKSVAIETPSVSGTADNDASVELGAELLTTNHTPTQPNSIATKAYADSRIWQGTQAEFNAIGSGNYDDSILYCITG